MAASEHGSIDFAVLFVKDNLIFYDLSTDALCLNLTVDLEGF
jgi:hypothetical protein